MIRAGTMEREIEEDVILDAKAMAELACLCRGEEEYGIAGMEVEDTCEDAEAMDATEMVKHEDGHDLDICAKNNEENGAMTSRHIHHG